MIKTYFFLLATFLFLGSYAQVGNESYEVEPNNTFASADTAKIYYFFNSTVNPADTVDYHIFDKRSFNGSLLIRLQATNNSALDSSFLSFKLYDGRQEAGLLESRNIGGRKAAPGETLYDTLIVCAAGADIYFARYSTTGDFTYKISWTRYYGVNEETISSFGNTQLINNDLRANASALAPAFNVNSEGSISYIRQGVRDTVDYWKATFNFAGAGTAGSKTLKIISDNYGCAAINSLNYFIYKNNATTPFMQGSINHTSRYRKDSVSLLLVGVLPGESIFIKLAAPNAANYVMKILEGADVDYGDIEPNDEFYDAIITKADTVYSGTSGDYNQSNEVDPYDTYKIIMPYAGTATFNIEAKNVNCLESSHLDFQLYDQDFQFIHSEGFVWNFNSGCNTQNVQVKIRGLEKDIFYFRLKTHDDSEGSEPSPVKYSFIYSASDSAHMDVEPNNTRATATTITEGDTYKGHVKFNGFTYPPGQFVFRDTRDHYKIDMPAAGRVKIFVKSKLRNEDNVVGTFNNRLTFLVGSYSTITPNLNQGSSISSDSLYFDTLSVCAVPQGIANIEVYSDLPYEYEFSIQIVDTFNTNEIEPNNLRTQATLIADSTEYKGLIGVLENSSFDTNDYYKIPINTTDSVILYLQARYRDCSNFGTNKQLRITIDNANGSQPFTKTIADQYTVPLGGTVYDTIRLFRTAPDTLFLRFWNLNSAKYSYEFKTNQFRPGSQFTVVGDTNACFGTKQYSAANVTQVGLNYHWLLPNGGGTLSNANSSTATVEWNTAGVFPLKLYLSNSRGSSDTMSVNVAVNDLLPPVAPVIANFARNLSVGSVPQNATVRWYRNGVVIANANAPTYYATLAGNYTAGFVNACGVGPISNLYNFPTDIIAQAITFPTTGPLTFTPTLKVKLPATASSGLPVFYVLVNGNGNIQNDSVRITGIGDIVIKAVQPGNDEYSAATDVLQTISVNKGNQFVVFDSIPDKLIRNSIVNLQATTNTSLPVQYQVISGNASVSGNTLTITGGGLVTVTASQAGNGNYNAAPDVNRTFCVGIDSIGVITGASSVCYAAYTYTVPKYAGVNYVWSLSGGGTMTTSDDTAFVTWTTPETYLLKVKANTDCNTTFSTEISKEIIPRTDVITTAVRNMLPVNGAQAEALPLTLSWITGDFTESFDLYIWDSTATQPAAPFAANLTTVSYTLDQNTLTYDQAYKWRVVGKNPCHQTEGPVQSFRLVPLPDLQVTALNAPNNAISGQSIAINWTVNNIGLGKTPPNKGWKDNVYLGIDSIPDYYIAQVNPATWNFLGNTTRPILLGSFDNVMSLLPGEQYSNAANFTIPITTSQPLYVTVITNYGFGNATIKEVTLANDTARKSPPIDITLAPTPDLRADSVFIPASVFSGTTVGVTYNVKNYGVLTPASALWSDQVYISRNAVFDSVHAIKLNSPKADGSYYPNAPKASVNINTQLQADSGYTRSIQTVIPNDIFGAWYIHVKVNDQLSLYEGPSTGNNVKSEPIQVYLSPTPHLTVSALTLPVTIASTNQRIGINWQIKNAGFAENYERNKGHYLERFIGYCCNTPVGSHSTTCTGSAVYFDSTANVQGSSFWQDQVYISSDAGGLNIANARLLATYSNGVQRYAGNLYEENGCPYPKKGIFNIEHALLPGSVFENSTDFTIPENLPSGTYYIYVLTNSAKTVFEYPGSPETRRSGPLQIIRPDLTVSSISSPANAVAGQPITVNYSVTNIGPGTVPNATRNDQLYMSTASVFNSTAVLLTTQPKQNAFGAGTVVANSITATIPPATLGNRYFYVVANFDSVYKEVSYSNNTSAAALTNFAAPAPVDLFVQSISLADTVQTIFDATINYQVINNGSGSGSGSYIDSVFVSCLPTFNPATAFYAARKVNNNIVFAAGATRNESISFKLPFAYEINNCFVNRDFNNAYFFVKTNSDKGIYEGADTLNNITASSLRVLDDPVVDLTVLAIVSADSARVGRPYSVAYQVQNIGRNPIIDYYRYNDSVFICSDLAFGSNKILLNSTQYETRLENGEIRVFTSLKNFANAAPGDYYLGVTVNANRGLYAEFNYSNNFNLLRDGGGNPKKINVIRLPLPDLVDSIIEAPSLVAVGQPMRIIHKIKNIGVGETFPASLKYQIDLTEGSISNESKYAFPDRTISRILQPGESVIDTTIIYIPANAVPRNYALRLWLNPANDIVESDATNNVDYAPVAIYKPDPVDLIVKNITVADTALLGYNLDFAKWQVQNLSAISANGISSDGIYLSSSSTYDSSAKLIGVQQRVLEMNALQTDSLTATPRVTNVVEGLYNMFVRTDILDQIPETNELNNTNISLGKVYVKVKELYLAQLEINTLATNDRYYKLVIPDSLNEATISVKLTSHDSLSRTNQIFVAKDYIPTAARFDYSYTTANYGNQEVIMANTTAGNYYVFVRTINPGTVVQNITLLAKKLPFQISKVESSTGGNIGNVTIKISGSLFATGMTAKLKKGATEILAGAIYFTNSTQLYATFNLQGKALGTYDVILSKADTAFATMENGFSIVTANNGGLITGSGSNTGSGNGNAPGCDPGAPSGLNSQLVTEVLIPEDISPGQRFIVQINYLNPTNFDIPSQVRTLYAEDIILLSFTAAGLLNGVHTVTVSLAEKDGPPGIIRPGGGGTILIYATTIPGLRGGNRIVYTFK